LSPGLLARLLLLPQRHQPQRLPLSSRLCRPLGRDWRVDGGDTCLPTKQWSADVLLYRPCSCCCWLLLLCCIVCCWLCLLLFALLLGSYQCC
jgi:hypothetical protein